MADSLTADLVAKLTWNFQEALDLSTVVDSATLEYKKAVADGVAADQADKIWHDTRSLASGANDDLDLTALTNTIFGSVVTITFVKVVAILIVNMSTTAGEELRLDSSVSNGFTGPFGGSVTSKIEVGPDSVLFLSSKKDGWTVTANTGDILRISNPASGANISYKIAIIGRSA